MKKKILFFARYLGKGGISHSLVQLINAMDFDKYDINLFICNPDIDNFIFNKIKKDVKTKILWGGGSFSLLKKLTSKKYEKNKIKVFIKFLIELIKLYLNLKSILKIVLFKPDVVIDYQGTYLANYISLVKKTKKISFIHENKYQATNSKKRKNKLKNKFKKYDKIVFLTNEQCILFQNLFLEMKEKFVHIYNGFDIDYIKRASLEEVKENEIKYLKEDYGLMLARLSWDKDFDTVINAFSLIKEDFKYKFYFLGDGERKKELEKKIIDSGLQDRIFLLGNKNNPFPWILNSKFLLLSSYYEGLNNSIIEGLILRKIVISSDFKYGAKEILKNGKCGFLFEAGNSKSLANILEKLDTDLENYNSQILESIDIERFKIENIVMKFNKLIT